MTAAIVTMYVVGIACHLVAIVWLVWPETLTSSMRAWESLRLWWFQRNWIGVPIPDHIDERGNTFRNCTIRVPAAIAHLFSGSEV